MTELSAPRVVNFAGSNPSVPTVIASFPNATGCTGIVEYDQDKYAVLVGNFSLSTPVDSIPGSWSLWSIDLTQDTNPNIEQIAPLPEVPFPNGLAVHKGLDKPLFLIAESTNGQVIALETNTNETSIAISDPLMARPEGNFEGINGLKLSGSKLYFTNSGYGYFASVDIKSDGSASGPATLIAMANKTGYPTADYYDDFAVASDGTAYVAGAVGNTVIKIAPDGQQTVIAGSQNSTEIAEPTAVALGIKVDGCAALYVTTGGGLGAPINGSVTVGGQLIEIQL